MIKVTVMRAGYQAIERDYYPTPGQAVVLSLTLTPGSGVFTCPGYTPPTAREIRATSPLTQQGEAGYQAATKPAVRVFDQYGNPMAGVSITFSRTAGTGSVLPASMFSGSDGGAALTTWFLSRGLNEVTVTALGLNAPVRFTATGVLAPRSLVAVSPQSQQGITGTAAASPPAVMVGDQYGNPLAGATVVFTASAAGGSVSPSSVVTGADGVARLTRWTFSTSVGTNTVLASIGDFRVVFSATVLAPAPVRATTVIETAPPPVPRLGEEALPIRGDPFDQLSKYSCQKFGTNFVLVGLKVQHKVTVLAGIDLFCASLRADGTLGIPIFLPGSATAGFQALQATCPSGRAVVGIQGTTDPKKSSIRSLQLYCNTILPTGLAAATAPAKILPALGIVSGNGWGPDMCTQSRPATAIAFHLELISKSEVWNVRLFCEQPTKGG